MAADFGELVDWIAAGADWAMFVVAVLALLVAAFGTVVSLIGAAAVVFLGLKANAIAKQSTEINESLAQLEFGAAKAEDKARDEERCLILVALASRIRLARSSLATLAGRVAAEDFLENYSKHPEAREEALKLAKEFELHLPDGIRDRLHRVGNPLAAKIARCDGSAALLVRAAELGTAFGEAEGRRRAANIIRKNTKKLQDDLADIRNACDDAEREAGVKDESE